MAPIVGAFAAGLILEEAHYHDFVHGGEHRLEELVRPISDFLIPIFFVQMGMQVDLAAFAQPGAWALAVLLTVAAVLGKQACAGGGIGSALDKMAIGLAATERGVLLGRPVPEPAGD